MKTIVVDRDYQFRLGPSVHVQYRGGETYRRVPEAQVRAIVADQAGRVIDERPQP